MLLIAENWLYYNLVVLCTVKVVNLKHRALYVSCTSKKVSHVFDYGLNIFRSGMCTATQHISGLSDVSAYDRVSQYIDR
jgi:hypothetical protein